MKYARNYNLGALIQHLAGHDSDAGFELECSQEISRSFGRKPQGVMVPMAALMQRDLVVGTNTAGGHTVATILASDNFINPLREVSVVARAGATFISGLQGNVAIPRQTSTAASYWLAESGSPTESQQGFDQVNMTPKTIAAFTDISRRMLLQSSINVTEFVRSDLTSAIGYAIDNAALNGTGASNQPTGILSAAGVQTETAGNLVPTWAKVVSMETLAATANALPDGANMAYVTTPELVGKLRTTSKVSGQNGFIIEGEDSVNGVPYMNGYRTLKTNHIPKNGGGTGKHGIVFANWSDLIIGQWSAVDITIDPYTLGTQGALRIVAMQDIDIVLRHPESFVKMMDCSLT